MIGKTDHTGFSEISSARPARNVPGWLSPKRLLLRRGCRLRLETTPSRV